MISTQQARKDWANLRNALLATEKAIERIVRNKSWEPLGYDSFALAWAAEMRDVNLASEVRPHVAYHMFAEGYGPEWVAEHLKGVGNRRTELWQQEWADGVPPGHAYRGNIHKQAADDETVVSEHIRKKPGKPGYIRFEVGETWHQEYKRIAKKMGTTVEDIARKATEDVFRLLVTVA